jgi:hypothetical protein
MDTKIKNIICLFIFKLILKIIKSKNITLEKYNYFLKKLLIKKKDFNSYFLELII